MVASQNLLIALTNLAERATPRATASAAPPAGGVRGSAGGDGAGGGPGAPRGDFPYEWSNSGPCVALCESPP